MAEENFKISECDSYTFVKTIESELFIENSISRTKKNIFEGMREGRWNYVQITKNCIPRLTEFLSAKYGESAYGRKPHNADYYMDKCRDGEIIYKFKRTTYELDESKTEDIVIYWIIGDVIDHVEIEAVAIPRLLAFIDEYF